MKVLHLIPYMHPSAGGPPVVVDAWCSLLGQHPNCEGQVLTTDAYADRDHDDQWIADYRSRFPITVVPKLGAKGFGYSLGMRSEFKRLAPSCDLVHVHNLWGYTNQLAARLCPRHNLPFVVSTHGMADPNSLSRKAWKKAAYGKLLEWPALRKANGVIFTHAEEESLARASCAGLPPGYVVPLGTEDPPKIAPSELRERFLKRFPQCRDRPLVMFLSRLHSKKGMDLLIPAFAAVVKQHPKALLVLVGPGEPGYVADLKRSCESHGIDKQTLFTGPLQNEDKWAALLSANVYALPSYQENFAIALVEALRMGTPVICSQRVNLWSDLQNAQAALICELNVESVAQCIHQTLADPENAAKRGKLGADYAAANFTWRKSTQRLVQVYQQVLDSAG